MISECLKSLSFECYSRCLLFIHILSLVFLSALLFSISLSFGLSISFSFSHSLSLSSLYLIFIIDCRKTCLVCKCPRETHAIYQEQVTSVKERLGLKPTANTSTLDAKQLGYTWIPPGIMAVNTVDTFLLYN